MSSHVKIPTADWRNLMNTLANLNEKVEVLMQVVKPTNKILWISEETAMQILGYKDHRTMRKKAFENHIAFTSEGNRNFK